MPTLTIPASLAEVLKTMTDLVVVQDSQGNIVGYIAPVSRDRTHLYPPQEPGNGAQPAMTEVEQQTA